MSVHYHTNDELLEKETEKAMELWLKFSKKYRNLKPEYYLLLDKKRRLRIKPLDPLTKSVLNSLPEIPFLYIEDEAEAREYLKDHSRGELIYLNRSIVLMVEGHSYKTIEARNCDFRWTIEHVDDECRPFGIDPNYPHTNSGSSKRPRSAAARRVEE